jgi:transposase-like protein
VSGLKKRKKQSEQSRWTRNRVKEEFWRKQIDLWQESGLSVRAFCRESGIVETSFYAWRRELIIRAREDGSAEELSRAMTPNTLKDGRGGSVAIRFRQTDRSAIQELAKSEEKPNPFVPIRLISTGAGKKNEEEAAKVASGQSQVEITLPNGAVIRLDDGCNPDFVARLLSSLRA